MEIEIEITREDYKGFNEYIYKNKKIFGRFRFAVPGFLILLIIVLNINRINDILYLVTQIVFILLVYFVLVLVSKQLRLRLIKKIPSEQGGILGKHTFRISDEGIWESTEHNNNLTKWSGILSVETTNKFIFIFVDTHMAHIIPKRYFNSEDDSNYFINFVINIITGN